MENLELCDVWRIFNPNGKRIIWRQRQLDIHCRNDFVLVFEIDQKADPQEEVNTNEDDCRLKKCLKDLNEQLLCCICHELMVLAHTLPCSHTFCFRGIRDWLCHSKNCPNCRAKALLKSAVPVKVLDNTINKVVEEGFSPEELEERLLKIQEMSKEAKKKNGKKVVPVSSTSDSESEDDESESVQESNDSDDYSEEESDYNDYSYGVEHARSGRALCRTCGSLIPNRSLRWVVAFNTRLGYRQYRQKYYHHLECYLPPDHVTFERLSNRFLTWTTGIQEHRTTSTEREDKLKPLVQQTTLFKKEGWK